MSIGKRMLRRSVWLLPLLLLSMTGCLSTDDRCEEFTPDITLDELEKKMLQARDPQGVFQKAKSYVQKQVVTTGRQKALCEVKFLAPDRFKLVTLKDNEPETAIILNGDRAWLVNYPKRSVTPITGESLFQLQTMSRLGNPDDSYQDLFQQVVLTGCRIDDREYYKLNCTSKLPDEPPMYLYIGKNNFLLKRVRIPAPVNYESTIERYALYEGVMIPETTVIDNNGVRQSSKIYENKLNADLDESEFLPPVFPSAD